MMDWTSNKGRDKWTNKHMEKRRAAQDAGYHSTLLLRLCLVQHKVCILIKVEDDVIEKLCMYDRLMWWKRIEVWIQTLDLNCSDLHNTLLWITWSSDSLVCDYANQILLVLLVLVVLGRSNWLIGSRGLGQFWWGPFNSQTIWMERNNIGSS